MFESFSTAIEQYTQRVTAPEKPRLAHEERPTPNHLHHAPTPGRGVFCVSRYLRQPDPLDPIAQAPRGLKRRRQQRRHSISLAVLTRGT